MIDFINIVVDLLKSDFAKNYWVQLSVVFVVYTVLVVVATYFAMRFFLKVQLTKIENHKSDTLKQETEKRNLENENAKLLKKITLLEDKITYLEHKPDRKASDDPALAPYIKQD